VTSYALRSVGADEIAARAAEFRSLYACVYGEPPYNETQEQADEFADHLVEDAAAPGFSFVVAEREAGSDSIIGFAYGKAFSADRWWRNAGEEPSLTRGAAKFAVMEFAVRPGWRRQGVGRALLSEVLSGRTEPFATLCANPTAPARSIYRSWGWEQVAVSYTPRLGSMDVLIKRLGQERVDADQA